MLHTRIRMVVFLILMGFLGMAGSVQAIMSGGVHAQTYIRGHVKDTGGRGIGNVFVLLYDAHTMEWVASSYTNDEGLYELDLTNSGDPIPLGTYKVCVSPGQDYFEQCYQGKDKPEEADVLRLTDGVPFLEEIDFTLTAKQPIGNLEGQVTDAKTAEPLSGVTVTVSELQRVTQTDDKGNYRFSLPVGTYTVEAAKTGYHQDKVVNVVVKQNQVTTQDFSLQPIIPARICGKVTQENNGKPIFSVKVFLKDRSYEALTDNNGNYCLEGLPPGTYTLRAEKAKYQPFEENITLAEGQELTKDIILTYIPSPGILSGKVIDGNGTLLQGVHIFLEGTSYEAYSDEDGSYRIEAPAGDYTVKAQKENYQGNEAQVTIPDGGQTEHDFVLNAYGKVTGVIKDAALGTVLPGATVSAGEKYNAQSDQNGIYVIYLPAGDWRLNVTKQGYKLGTATVHVEWGGLVTQDLDLVPSATIQGLVTDSETEEPLSGVVVMAGGYQAVTGDDGRYQLQVVPGNYNATADLSCYEQGHKEVTISDGEIKSADFVLTPKGSISGSLVNAPGEVMVGLWDCDTLEAVRSTTLNTANKTDFSFKVPCGSYYLAAFKEGQIIYYEDDQGKRCLTVDEDHLSYKNLDITFPEQREFGIISGTVLNIPEGLVYSEVWAYSDITGGFGIGDVNDNGTYEITDLIPADDYLVVIFLGDENTPAYYNGGTYAPDPTAATKVSVTAGHKTPNIDFNLKDFLRYKLTFTITGGLKAGELYSLRALSDEVDQSLSFVPTQAEASGNFTRTLELPPGSYQISVDAPDGTYFYVGEDQEAQSGSDQAKMVDLDQDKSISFSLPIQTLHSLNGTISGLSNLGEHRLEVFVWSDNVTFRRAISLDVSDLDEINYQLSKLPEASDYRLGIHLPGRDLSVYWKEDGLGFKPEDADMIVLSSDESGMNFDLSSLTLGKIAGDISGLNPGERASIIAVKHGVRRISSVVADAKGEAHYLMQVPAGNYILTCWPRNHKAKREEGINVPERGTVNHNFVYTRTFDITVQIDLQNLDSSEYELILALSGGDFYDQEIHDISGQNGTQIYNSTFQAPSGNYTALATLYQGDNQVAYREKEQNNVNGDTTIVLDPIDLSNMLAITVDVKGVSGSDWVDIVVLDNSKSFYTGYGEKPAGDEISHTFALPAGTYYLQAVVWSNNMSTPPTVYPDYPDPVDETRTYPINCGGGE